MLLALIVIYKSTSSEGNYADNDAVVWKNCSDFSQKMYFLQLTVMFLDASIEGSSVREHLYSPVLSRETFTTV